MLSSSLRRLSSRTTRYVRVFCVPMSSVFFFFSSRRRHTRFDCDWSSDVCSSDLAALSVGVAFVKLGLAGVTSEARADRLAGAARRALETAVVTRLVLVAYADWRSAASLPPARVVAVAADTGAAGVLLDTAAKRAPLFAVESPAGVAAWVAAAHAAGLFAALAGGLCGPDLARARSLGAAVVGVRGAACRGGRTGRVSRARVAALRALAAA